MYFEIYLKAEIDQLGHIPVTLVGHFIDGSYEDKKHVQFKNVLVRYKDHDLDVINFISNQNKDRLKELVLKALKNFKELEFEIEN